MRHRNENKHTLIGCMFGYYFFSSFYTCSMRRLVAQHTYLTIRPKFWGTVPRMIVMSMPILSHFFSDFFSAFLIIFGMETSLGLTYIHGEMAAVLHME